MSWETLLTGVVFIVVIYNGIESITRANKIKAERIERRARELADEQLQTDSRGSYDHEQVRHG
jgi:hypothetical protein